MCIYYRNRTRTELAVGTAFLIFSSLLSICIFQICFAFEGPAFNPYLLTHEKSHRKNFTGGENVRQVVHIDLKGSPPKMAYLENLLETLSKAGVRAVMIEYDDMFPYQAPIEELSAHSAFSQKDISHLVDFCHQLNIEIIPMVQTFGHLELALKLRKYMHLREDTFNNRVICPSHPDTEELVQEMIKQILHRHPHSTRIHIGSDKVGVIKKCNLCITRPDSEHGIFLEYIASVASFIRNQYHKRVTPLLWDNMLRPMPLDLLKNSNLENLLEIVIHVSDPVLPKSIRVDIWPKYTQVFKRIWLAGAFRGADSTYSLLPHLEARVQNQEAWFDFMCDEVNQEKSPGVTIVGFIWTGSSKADHFAASVDLLPVSAPSLLFNVLKMNSDLKAEEDEKAHLRIFSRILGCQSAVRTIKLFRYDFLIKNCKFAAKQSLQFTVDFLQIVPKVNELYKDLYEYNPWITPYHIRRNFINPVIIKQHFEYHNFKTSLRAFYEVHRSLMNDMRIFFKENIVQDWFLMYVETFDYKMRTLHNFLVNAVNLDVFPRRE